MEIPIIDIVTVDDEKFRACAGDVLPVEEIESALAEIHRASADLNRGLSMLAYVARMLKAS